MFRASILYHVLHKLSAISGLEMRIRDDDSISSPFRVCFRIISAGCCTLYNMHMASEHNTEDDMDRNENEEPREDLVVEITDLNEAGDDESSSSSPRLFTGSWLLAPKYRKHRTIATVAFVGLAILVVLFTTTP